MRRKILALLLVHPLAERDDQKWIRVFARDFWLAIMPAVVMLWLAIYQRVHQYGITEPRFFLLALSIWLGALAAWYALSRSRRITVIPASLCAIALLTFAGPASAYRVSERSQLGRLKALLGEIPPAGGGRPRAVPFRVSREVSQIVRYLLERHDATALAPLLPPST